MVADPAALKRPGVADARGHPLPRPAGIAAALTIAALGVLTGWWMTPRPASPRVAYALDVMLDGLEVGGDMAPSLSPDGRWLVYRASGRLWRRALNQFTSIPVPDSSSAQYPFWSPDSRQIAFVRDGRVWRLPLDATNATLVGDVPKGLSGSGAGVWTVEGDLVFAGSDTIGLLSIPVAGGTPRDILPLDKAKEIDFHQVAALPPGRGLLVAVHRLMGSDTIAVVVNGKRTTVLQLPGETIRSPTYSPAGYLLFDRETTSPGIWAVRFSIDRLATEGAPFLVAAGGWSPTVGSDGTLAFVRGSELVSELVWIDRKGSIQPIGRLQGQLGEGSVLAVRPGPSWRSRLTGDGLHSRS